MHILTLSPLTRYFKKGIKTHDVTRKHAPLTIFGVVDVKRRVQGDPRAIFLLIPVHEYGQLPSVLRHRLSQVWHSSRNLGHKHKLVV